MELYHKFHTEKGYTLIGLFRAIKKKFNPKRILYPGCYVHITPSLVFSDVVYVDSFRNTDKFFQNQEVKQFLISNKEYRNKCKFVFYKQDYFDDLTEKMESFDAIISLYGGFVSKAVKKYLKKGGILICNDSHGDASMASLDPDFKLIAVFNRKADDNYSISSTGLNQYLIPKGRKKITKNHLETSMRGIAYTKSPSGYIFMKK